MSKPINSQLRIPIVNDHYGFKFGSKDYQDRYHPGVDLNGPGGGDADKGTPVHPIGPGIVSFVAPLGKRNRGWGNLVYVKHDMAQYFLSFRLERPEWCPEFIWSQYAHLDNVLVEEGDSVDQDTVLGPLGGTGGWSAHLHHEIRKRPLGVWFYPRKGTSMDWIKQNYFDPEVFVSSINVYISGHLASPSDTITETLIKAEKQNEVYVYNGELRFHVQDEESALLLFGPDWAKEIQEISIKQLKDIPEGDPIPSMKL